MKRSMTLLVATVLAGISSSVPAGARAQGLAPVAARQFAELARQNLFGEPVTVTSTGGVVLRGTILDIDVDGEILELRTETTDFRLPATGIRTIERRFRDPVGNGALIGAGAGIGIGLLWLTRESGGSIPAVSLFTGSLGAAIGAGIDFAYHASETIYRGATVTLFPEDGNRSQAALAFRIEW